MERDGVKDKPPRTAVGWSYVKSILTLRLLYLCYLEVILTGSPMAQAQTFQLPSVVHDVEQRLRERIGRDWAVGTCLPSIKELARELDAGQSTTHMAVKRLAARGLLVSRRGQGTFVLSDGLSNQQPAPAAETAGRLSVHDRQSLSTRRVTVVHTSDSPDGLFRRMVSSLTRGLLERGIDTVREVFPHQWPAEPGILNTDAVVFVQPHPDKPLEVNDNQIMLALGTAVQPEVWMGSRYDVVEANSFQGAMLAGRHMRELGCGRVFAMVGTRAEDDPTLRPLSQQRIRGFEIGFGEPVPEDHRYFRGHTSQYLGVEALKHYLTMQPRPDGVFSVTDDAACGFQIAALAHNLQPGKDFHLIGFDGLDQGSSVPGGPLTSVRAPVDLIGRRGAELLVARLLQPDRPVERIELGYELFRGR